MEIVRFDKIGTGRGDGWRVNGLYVEKYTPPSPLPSLRWMRWSVDRGMIALKTIEALGRMEARIATLEAEKARLVEVVREMMTASEDAHIRYGEIGEIDTLDEWRARAQSCLNELGAV
jgi:hypothetical protein